MILTDRIFIRFTDGSKITLDGVQHYRWNRDNNCLVVTINNNEQMFNLDYVMFVGRVFDLGREVISE